MQHFSTWPEFSAIRGVPVQVDLLGASLLPKKGGYWLVAITARLTDGTMPWTYVYEMSWSSMVELDTRSVRAFMQRLMPSLTRPATGYRSTGRLPSVRGSLARPVVKYLSKLVYVPPTTKTKAKSKKSASVSS